jgi:hypothetical protein
VLVPEPPVALQRRDGRLVQRHLTGSVVLGVAHGKQRGGVVQVVLVEADRLADP